jgi:O-antigen ligase
VTAAAAAAAVPATPLASTLPSAGTLAVGAVLALAAIAVLVTIVRRYDEAFPLLAVFALPFRLPIATGGRTVNLLIPLYLVVAAGTLTYLLPRLLGWARRATDASADAAGAQAGMSGSPAGASGASKRLSGAPTRVGSWLSPRGAELLLLAAVGLYALQTLYSGDRGKGAENIAFFYVPFALLFMILRDVHWTRALLVRCLGVAVALAVVFAGVGFVEYYRKALFLNPKVVQANQYDNYFRVNSVFFDPSIYGRFLALVMIALTTAVLTRGSAAYERVRRRDVLVGAAVLLWLLAGLVTSFSQSSIAALVLGLAILGAWCWGVRLAVLVSVIVLVVAGVFVLLAPTSLHFGLKGSGGSANNATNGRGNLISGGLELFAKRPFEGYGPGSFESEYKLHSKANAESAVSASHTIPVTVAAEQGILGLALYVALLVAALVVLFRGAGRSPPRIAIAACFAALVLHTWTYADFLEDPTTWLLLAIGVALARQDDRRPARGGVLSDAHLRETGPGAGAPVSSF